jgi:hypothetical protein
MRLTVEELEVLDLATEDYYEIWEVSWRLATISNDDSLDFAREAAAVVESLWERGLIELYTQATDSAEPVRVERISGSINFSAPDLWTPPQVNEPRLLIASTDLGESAREENWETIRKRPS